MLDAAASFFGAAMPPLLILSGVLFAVRLRGFYIFHPIKTLSLMTRRRGDGMPPVKAASMALAGTLGVGNITGVISAIYMGGPGAIFWMWASAFAAMSVKYAEVALAVRYRRRGKNGFYGGAPYYISGGIGTKGAHALGCVFAVLCICNSFTVGGILQVNAAAGAVSASAHIPPHAVGIILAALPVMAAAGGARRIANLTVYLIPAVSAVYIIMCAAVIILHAAALPAAVAAIFKCAFSDAAAVGGIGGYAVSEAVRYGVVRGVITNEAGAGTSPTAHACADAESPESQGCLGIFEVFADTIIICTLTALTALVSGVELGADAMADANTIFVGTFGGVGGAALSICVFVFVLATLFSQHYYARSAIMFLGGGGKCTALFTIAFCAVIIAGSGMAPPAVWTAADITVGVMTILNLYCLYRLRKLIYPPREITSDAKKSQNSAASRVGAADPDRIRRRRPSGGGDMI